MFINHLKQDIISDINCIKNDVNVAISFIEDITKIISNEYTY